MGKIRTQLLATAALVALSSAAYAADMGMPLKAPPPAPPPVQDWSGVYVGVEGGYGWGRQQGMLVPNSLRPSMGEFGNNASCGLFGEYGTPFAFRDCNYPTGTIQSSAVPHEFGEFDSALASIDKQLQLSIPNMDTSGWLFGAFFGVQKQWGNWVLGIEADVDGGDIKGSSSASVKVEGFAPNDEHPTELLASHSASLQSQIDELSSVRGKVGWAWSPNWMVYGTGGMAFAHVKNTLNDNASLEWFDGSGFLGNPDGESISFFANQSFAASANQTMLGWTLGAGIDYKVQIDPGSAWVFGVEYQYFNFPSQTFTFSNPGNGASIALNTSESINVVKGRISYLFSIH
jgi:outer membrane immunogenic protein